MRRKAHRSALRFPPSRPTACRGFFDSRIDGIRLPASAEEAASMSAHWAVEMKPERSPEIVARADTKKNFDTGVSRLNVWGIDIGKHTDRARRVRWRWPRRERRKLKGVGEPALGLHYRTAMPARRRQCRKTATESIRRRSRQVALQCLDLGPRM